MSPVCAHCGELFDDDRLACPHCGADADLTWSGEGEPSFGGDDDEYEAFVARELGDGTGGARWVPIAIAIAIIALLLWLVLG